MNFTKHTLKNGMRVVLAPMKDTATVTVEILVEAGSKYENKRNNGISHFLEHMMFKGTKKRSTTKKISEELDSVGSEYNAFTSEEQTGYYVKTPAQHFEMAFDVIADMNLNSILDPKEIERERGVILQEEAMYKDTPTAFIGEIFEELLYGNQPAGWRIIGPPKNIERFKRKDFIDYLQSNYLPKHMVLTVAGSFDQERALKLAKEYFEKNKEGNKKTQKKEVKQPQKQPQMSIFEKDTDQTHLVVGVRGPHMFSKDRYAASLLGTVLGGGMSSRMFINIRERHGLTYYIGSSSEMTTDTGYIYARAGVKHNNLQKAVKLILKEFKKTRDKKVSIKELKKAKEYVKGITLMGLESSSAVASFIGGQELFRKKIKTPEEIFKKIDAVTADDIQKVAGKVFVNKGLNLAVIGPQKKNEESLRKILKFS